MDARFASAMIAASLAASFPARAYVLAKDQNGNVEHWAENGITFGAPSTFPDQLSPDATRQALAVAGSAWNNAANLDIQISGTSEGEPGYDPSSTENGNGIFFLTDTWPYGQGLIAVTVVTVDITSGTLLDADIMFNSVERTFAILPDTSQAGGPYDDVQNTATHEFGHSVGMAHNPSLTTATMYPGARRGEVNKRDLSSDDVAGVKAIYPAGAGGGAAGCSTASGGPFLATLLFVALAFARNRRRLLPALACATLSVAAPSLAEEPNAFEPDAVARGQVVKSASHWNEKRRFIVTDVTVRVDTCESGSCPAEATMTLLGGRVGNIVQYVNGDEAPKTGDVVRVSFKLDAQQRLGVPMVGAVVRTGESSPAR
jgi:uncharacterized protein (TIGR03382 family)